MLVTSIPCVATIGRVRVRSWHKSPQGLGYLRRRNHYTASILNYWLGGRKPALSFLFFSSDLFFLLAVVDAIHVAIRKKKKSVKGRSRNRPQVGDFARTSQCLLLLLRFRSFSRPISQPTPIYALVATCARRAGNARPRKQIFICIF